jgi:hypothetical protein
MLKHWFTESDNVTWDMGRTMWFVSVIAFLYKMITNADFDPNSTGIGLSALLAGGGGMIWLKSKERKDGDV